MAALLSVAFGAFLVVRAVRPPVPLVLDNEGAAFEIPPLKVEWDDVREINLSTHGINTIVELVVDDVQTYLSQLSESHRNSFKYDTSLKLMSFTLVAAGPLPQIRQEFDLRWRSVKGIEQRHPSQADSKPKDAFTFNARRLSSLALDRLYRFYYRDGEFFVIRIGGQGNLDSLAAHFGLLGALANLFFQRGTKKPEEVAQLDDAHPSELLDAHKHNFKFSDADVVDASIDTSSIMQSHGPHVGRFSLSLSNGQKHNFQFEEMVHMRCAVQNLPGRIGSALRMNVRWNDQKGIYEKS